MTSRKRLPSRRRGLRATVCGAHLATGEYTDGTLGEIFITYQKEGTFARDALNALAMSISLGLQHGIPLSAFQHTFRSFKMEPDMIMAIFAELTAHYAKEQHDEV